MAAAAINRLHNPLRETGFIPRGLLAAPSRGGSRRGGGFGGAAVGDGLPQARSRPAKPRAQLESRAAKPLVCAGAERVESRTCGNIQRWQLW